MLNSMIIYSRTKQTSIEVFNTLETIKQLPLKYLSSYSLTLTAQQISDLNSNGSVQINIDSVELNKAKYVRLTLDNNVILLERQRESYGMATFGASFVLNPGIIQLTVLNETTVMLYLQDITLSILENDAGFITQDDVDLTNYYTKSETDENINNNLAIKIISEDITFVNGTKPSYTNGWYNFTGTITINGTDVSSNGYWDETSLIQIKDDGDRVYFYFIDPDDIEHKDYLSAYVYYDVEAGIWKPEENDSVYTKKVLTKENTNEYTPKADYNPATKKYVDDAIAELKTYIDNAIANAVFAADATDHEPTTTIE